MKLYYKKYVLKIYFSFTGFVNRAESEYDAFGTGHSSTSISAGLGMAMGRDLLGKNNHVVSIIGDGAITGGMAYEAMNNAGFLDKNMVIILNDNQQVSQLILLCLKENLPISSFFLSADRRLKL